MSLAAAPRIPSAVEHKRATSATSLLLHAFDAYHAEFQRITARAQARFEQRAWHHGQRDTAERLKCTPMPSRM